MAATETINVRLPEDLKRQGTQVLKQNGISLSEAIRRMLEYLNQEQMVPEWMLAADASLNSVQVKRQKLRFLAGSCPVDPDVDAKEVYRAHLLEEHSPKANE